MQIGLKMNEIEPFIFKVNRYDIFWWFLLFAYLIFYILLLKRYLLWDQAIFFGNCYVANFELDIVIILVLSFLKLSSNFGHLLLQYLRRNCFEKVKKISKKDERFWLVTLGRVLVSIEHSPYLRICGKNFPIKLP